MEPVSLGQALGLGLVAGIGSWVGAYYGGYWKKKGEQAATHEDLQNVVKEVRAVTKTTEEIKAEISGGLWDRQKRWEMRREAVFEMTRKIAGVDDALTSLHSMYQYYAALAETQQLVDSTAKAKDLRDVSVKWGKAADAYDETLTLMTIVGSRNVYQSLRDLLIFMRRLVPGIQQNPQHYLDSAPELAKRLKNVQELLRKELGVDDQVLYPVNLRQLSK